MVPTYEFVCHECEILFEELFLSMREAREHAEFFPCQSCKKPAPRVPSATNFKFGASSMPQGNSGSHDVDYPTLDKAVGRSSSQRWQKYGQRKAERDKLRKEAGTNAIAMEGDKSVAASPKLLETREKAFKIFKKTKDAAG